VNVASKRTLKRAKSKTLDSGKELRQIERLLGEEFDSLAEARRALKRESTPATKPVASKRSPKKTTKNPRSSVTYSIRDLSVNQRRSIESVLLDKASAIEVDKKLLRNNEQWGAIIPHTYTGTDLNQHKGQARTYQLYGRLDQLFKKLNDYLQHARISKVSRTKVSKFLDEIKVVRWGSENATQRENRLAWAEEKDKEIAERNVRKKQVRKMVTDEVKARKKAERKVATLERKVAKMEAEKRAKQAAKRKGR
jgi:hypothetical protein